MSAHTQTVDAKKIVDATEEGCPECHADVSTDGREVVCESCGLVVEERLIDHGPEWRAFSEQERNKRVRAGRARTERLHDHGLTTQIGFGRQTLGEDGDPQRISRLRTWHKRSITDRGGRNLARILSEVRRIATGIELGDAVLDRACRLGRESHGDGVAIGSSLESVAAASVLAAARDEGVPIVAQSVLEHTDVSRRRLWSKYHDICEVCDVATRPIQPVEHIPSIASELGLSDDVRRLAEDLAIEGANRGVHSGRKPAGIAAACIYVSAAPYLHTQSDIAEASSVCTVTIRNARDRLLEVGLIAEDGASDYRVKIEEIL